MRRRYDLLKAPEYAALANEVAQRNGGPLPFQPLPTAAGTDWQAEAYRPAGLQQHLLSVSGQYRHTGFLLSTDFRQQDGLLRHSQLTRYGVRLALNQQVGERLTMQGTVLLGQTTQTLPFTTSGASGATLAAVLAPPTAPVRDAQGAYLNIDPASGLALQNPVQLADNSYRQPRTRRLLAQLGAGYRLGAHLTAQASGSFERTLLAADSYWQPMLANYQPGPSTRYGYQTYYSSQWVARLALRYQRRLGTHHQLEAALDYSLQGAYYDAKTTYSFSNAGLGNDDPSTRPYGYFGYFAQSANMRALHRPWGRLTYRLDSALTVEVGLGTARFKTSQMTGYYPSAQVSWHPQLAMLAGRQLAPTLWLGAARTSLLGFGYGYGNPATLTPANNTYVYPFSYRQQAPYYTDQVEAGLQLGTPEGRFSAQLVAYQRLSYHVLLSRAGYLPSSSGYSMYFIFDEATSRNQGLELTLTSNWHVGPVLGTTRLVASANRNRLQGDEFAIDRYHFPQTDNQPSGALYGYQQDGLNADGSIHYAGGASGTSYYGLATVLGSGIPSQLLGLSQQASWGHFAFDAQLDAMLGYQLANYQLAPLDVPSGRNNSTTNVRDRWTPTNQNTNVPVAGTTDYSYAHLDADLVINRMLESGSHLRLSSLTVSYRLRHAATQDLSLWAGGQNLFVLSNYRGYDPNVSSGGNSPALAGRDYGAVPVPRTWLLGVRATL